MILAALTTTVTGCGDGLTDGEWRTVFFDDFNRPDGTLSGSSYELFEPGTGGSSTLVSQRLFVTSTAGGAGTVLFVGPKMSRRIRMSADLILSGTIDDGPMMFFGVHASTPDLSVSDGYACGLFLHELLFHRISDGTGIDLAPPLDVSAEMTAWDSGEKRKLTIEVDTSTVTCTLEGELSTYRLGVTDERFSGGYARIKANGFGTFADVHLDDLRIEE